MFQQERPYLVVVGYVLKRRRERARVSRSRGCWIRTEEAKRESACE